MAAGGPTGNRLARQTPIFAAISGDDGTEVCREEQLNESEDEKPRAELGQLREGVGSIWWKRFFGDESAEIARREKLVGVILWTEAERMPIDLFSYIREASRCFSVARYLAAIAMASCAVELVLNRDRRAARHRSQPRLGGSQCCIGSRRRKIVAPELAFVIIQQQIEKYPQNAKSPVGRRAVGGDE